MNLARQRTSDLRSTYSMGSMFVWMVYVAVPLAFFRLYVRLVTNTADGTTIPLRNAPGIAIIYMLLGFASLAIICLALVWKRQYAAALLSVFVVSFALIFGFPMLDKAILNPVQGSSSSYRNTDAAIIAATACRTFYNRSNTWPKSWEDLRPDLDTAATTLSTSQLKEVNSDPNRPTDRWTFEEIQKSVDIDFATDPKTFANQNWTNFTGIVPHRPCYNVYREQFSELITALSSLPQESK